jgi:predicted GNAT family acetyltransferase
VRTTPEIEFKAEIGVVAGGVAQVQGVWIPPHLRGRGLSAPAMAAVVRAAQQTLAPTISLYANAHNERALRCYRRVGFEQVGVFATVLF